MNSDDVMQATQTRIAREEYESSYVPEDIF
jgi:hypothetical protein